MTVKQMPSASDDTMRNIMILLSSHNSHNGGSSVRTTERNFCSYVRHGKPQSLFCETLKTTTKGLIYMKKLNIMDEYRLVNKVIMTNRIYNMDCLEGLRRMPDNSVDLILTDPPYFFDTKKGKGTGIVKDSKYLKEIEYMCNGFNLRILDECMRVLRGNAFFFCSKEQIPMYIEYFADTGMNVQVLTWSKTDVPPLCNGKYLSDTEYIIYAYRADSADKYPLITDHFITKRVRADRKDPLYHPCKKPIEILSTLIQSASKEGDVVLDMFSGSASTAVSCIETGRKFIGFELMEKYYNVGNKRIALALSEHPEYDLASMPLVAAKDTVFSDDNAIFNFVDDGEIDLAFFDVCGRDDIPFDLIEKVISKQKKPNLYIMLDMVQFPTVLMYFVRQKYKYDIITVHRHNCTRYIIFLRKGGVKLYGTYHTKRKFFVDDRDMSLPCRDEIPPELFRRLLINSSLPGGVVFCSGGYGTTVKECIAENRRFIAYEESNAILMHCVDAIKQSKLNLPDRYTGQEIYS